MITKYSDAEIVDVVSVEGDGSRKIASFEHLTDDIYRTNDGYMYVKVRAISSRVNKNNDGWPVHELAGMNEADFRTLVTDLDSDNKTSSSKLSRTLTSSNIKTRGEYGFKTFRGRPVFVDHNNTNPHRARGIIVDSLLHVEPSDKKYSSDGYWTTSPENHKPETWVELLLEVDAKSFPRLARQIKQGKVNAVSMGANVDHTLCSICGNKARTTDEYCDHIRRKGMTHIDKEGNIKKAYEDCVGVNFFEISFVFDPADVTALTTGPVIAKTAAPQGAMPDYLGKAYRLGFEHGHSPEKTNIQNPQHFMKLISGMGEGWSPEETQEAMERYFQGHEHGGKERQRKDLDMETAFHAVPSQDDNDWLNGLGIQNWSKVASDPSQIVKWTIMLKDGVVLEFNGPNDQQTILNMLQSEQGYDPSDVQGMSASDELDTSQGMPEYLRNHQIEMNEAGKPTIEDHDWLNDHGIRWAKVQKQAETVTPDRIDTLRTEANCPYDIKHCGMSDEGSCDVCGYEAPPKGFDDPDIDESKRIQERVDKIRSEHPDEEGLAIPLNEDPSSANLDRLRNLRQMLQKRESRNFNIQNRKEFTKMKSEIVLQASVEKTPSDEELKRLGWVIDAGEEISVAEDGKKATDIPQQAKVVKDQLAPVEASKKEAMGETQLMQNEGIQHAQFTDDDAGGNFRDERGITEHQPGNSQKAPAPMFQDGSSAGAQKKPQFTSPETGGKTPTQGLKEHQPSGLVENSYPTPGTGPNGGNGAEGKPQFTSPETGGDFYKADGIPEHHPSGIPGRSSSSLLNSMKLADLEIELNLLSSGDKYARVADLENEDEKIVVARLETLQVVKEAGLKKHADVVVSKTSMPSLRSMGSSSSAVTEVADEAIFS